MRPELSSEQLQRRRFLRRRILLIVAMILNVAGYAFLAIPPETPMVTTIPRAFWGMGFLFAGFFVALLSRLTP